MAGLPSSIPASEHRDPEWGVFPAEQYLIRHWDAASGMTPNEQRLELVRAFTQTDFGADGSGPPPAPRAPTDAEVRDILEPWRPQKLRRIAYALLCRRADEFVILRTFYGEGSDELMAAILEEQAEESPDFEPGHRWWSVLDDPDLFGHPEQKWRPVLDALPELVGHNRRLEAPHRMHLTREEAASLVEEREEINSDYDFMSYVHSAACQPGLPLLVADQEALEDKALLCLFLDGFGNIVRRSFLEPQNFEQLKIADEMGRTPEQHCWLMEDPEWDRDVKLGKKYKPGGEMALRLYPAHLAQKGAKWAPRGKNDPEVSGDAGGA